MKAADYLFPRDLQVSDSGIRKVLVIGSCLSENYLKDFGQLYPEIGFDYVHFNNLLNLPELEQERAAGYQLQYVQIPLRTLLGDNMVRIVDFDRSGALETVEEQAKAMLRAVLKAVMKYNEQFGLLTVVANFLVPQSNLAPSLHDRGETADFGRLVRAINQCLDEEIKAYRNAYVADVDSAASTFGKRFFLDDVVAFYSHNADLSDKFDVNLMDNHPSWSAPHSARVEDVPLPQTTYGLQAREFSEIIFRQMESIHRIVSQVDTVKIVIFDLDNTLWRGQIAEHYEHGNEWPVFHMWPVGIWEAIHHLRRRGIVVSISSKNDEHIVRERWNRAVGLPWLSYDDFLLPKVNWLPKSQNIKDTLATLSLTAKSAVFVDDNPIERDEVRKNIPGIRVIGADPYSTRRILLWSAETQRSRLGAEAGNREKSYRDIAVRETEKSSMSREDFLAGLDVKLTCEIVRSDTDQAFARVKELINKTNQFNTTGVRWSGPDFTQFFEEGGEIYSFSVRDKFSDYGQVGALVHMQGVLRQFTLSCRVLGMDVEVAALNHVAQRLFAADAELLVGAVVETELNTPSRDVYLRAGFAATSQPGVFALDRNAQRPAAAHVEVEAV
jgi:FkbH-like protein